MTKTGQINFVVDNRTGPFWVVDEKKDEEKSIN